MLLVIQGTNFCNLDCSYCYLPGRDKRNRIETGTIRALALRIAKMRALPEAIRVVWHAGEPFVLPTSFYEDAFAAFQPVVEAGAEVMHGFQTNGTLIDEEWIGFLSRWKPSLGVSVDGPQAIHDAVRRYRNGAGSWSACMRGIHRLQSAAIPFHTISVVTPAAAREPDRMFDFFLENELHDVALNIEEVEGINARARIDTQLYEGLYREFFARLLRLNAAAGYPIRFREAESAAAALINDGIEFNSQVEPGRILSIDVEGNVTTFSPELLGLRNPDYRDFVIGNVRHQELDEMLSSPVAKLLEREIGMGIEKCSNGCDFFRFCKGGAPANKLGETGSFRSDETMFCRLTVKATLEVCMDNLLDQAVARNARSTAP
jgi:uncharacterized protein